MPPGASLPSRISILHLWSSRINRELPNSWRIHLGVGRPTEKTLLILLAYLCGNVQQSPCALCSSNKTYSVPNNHGRVWKTFPFPFCVVVDEAHAWAIEQFLKPAVNGNEEPQQSKVCCNQLCQFYPASTRRAAMRPTRSHRESIDASFVSNSANSQTEALPAISDSDEEDFEEQLNQLTKTKKKSMPVASRLDEGQPSQPTKWSMVLPAVSDSDEELFAEQLDQLGKTKKKRARHSSDECDEDSSSSEGPAPPLRTPIALRTTPRVSSARREQQTPTKSAKRAENTNMARFTPMTRDRNSGMDFNFAGDVRPSAIPHPFSILTGRPVSTSRRQNRTADSPSASQVAQQPNMAEWELAPGHIPEAVGDPRQCKCHFFLSSWSFPITTSPTPFPFSSQSIRSPLQRVYISPCILLSLFCLYFITQPHFFIPSISLVVLANSLHFPSALLSPLSIDFNSKASKCFRMLTRLYRRCDLGPIPLQP